MEDRIPLWKDQSPVQKMVTLIGCCAVIANLALAIAGIWMPGAISHCLPWLKWLTAGPA